MNRYEKLVAERNELADGITYVRTALDVEDVADDDFAAGIEYCKTGQERLAELDDLIDGIETVRQAAVEPRNVFPGAHVPNVNLNLNRTNDVDFDALTRGRLDPGETRDAALAVVERAGSRYGVSADRLENAERLARKGDAFARHIATFGQEVYAEAWAKHMTGRDYMLSDAEARALAVGTATSAGNLVPTHLDPSIMLSNAGSYNPFRQIARQVSLASPGPNEWNGVTSAGVTASWDAEAAEVSDDSPETANPSIPVYKGAANVIASYEALEDVANLGSEVLMMFADAKDRLEAAAFATGTGSAQPTGIITQLDASTFVEVSNTTAATLGIVDLHKALNGLAARFRDRSTFVMSPEILGTIEQLGTGLGGATMGNLAGPYTQSVLGRPAVLSSSFPGTPSSTTQVENWLVVGDFSQYVIVDKIGMRTVYDPVVLGSNRRPSGQAQWYMHWRTGAEATHIGTATTNRAFVLLQDITSA